MREESNDMFQHGRRSIPDSSLMNGIQMRRCSDNDKKSGRE